MYQALYRKWRPLVFADVIGQPHITTTLQRQVESGRLSHAYLFTGSRGTGKTTCAKILARASCCEKPRKGDPCNACAACKGILDGSILDVVEIDAASNSGVENIRALREETAYAPVAVAKRVYIIDEVHMLSQGAFNALLKTLEEPPLDGEDGEDGENNESSENENEEAEEAGEPEEQEEPQDSPQDLPEAEEA